MRGFEPWLITLHFSNYIIFDINQKLLKHLTPLDTCGKAGVPPPQREGMAWPTCQPPLCGGGEGESRPCSGALLSHTKKGVQINTASGTMLLLFEKT